MEIIIESFTFGIKKIAFVELLYALMYHIRTHNGLIELVRGGIYFFYQSRFNFFESISKVKSEMYQVDMKKVCF